MKVQPNHPAQGSAQTVLSTHRVSGKRSTVVESYLAHAFFNLLSPLLTARTGPGRRKPAAAAPRPARALQSPKAEPPNGRDQAPRDDERYRQLVELSPDAIVIHQKGRYVFLNQAAARLFGADSPAQLIGTRVLERIHPDERSLAAERIKRQLNRQELAPLLEQTCLRLDGSVIHVEVRSEPFEYRGKPAVQAVIRDVTDRKRAEQALRESEAKFRVLAETLPIAIGIYRSDRFLYVNPASQRLSGYTEAELLQMSFLDIVHPEFRDLAREYSRRRLKGEPAPTNYEFKVLLKSGAERWVEFAGGMIQYEGAPALLGTAFDITARKRAEKLQAAVYQIAQAVDRSPSLDDLYKNIHVIISEVMPANNFYIALHDAERNLMTFPYFVDELDQPPAPRAPRRFLTDYVWRTGRSLLCTREVDLALQEKGEVEVAGAPSAIWLGVPLRVGEKTIGVMAVQHYADPDAYGAREQQMLEFVSSQVAQAIKRKEELLSRARAETALLESEERYRNLFENAPIGIYRTTPDGRIIAANPELVRMLGYASADEFATINLEVDGAAAGYRRKDFRERIERDNYVRGYESAWRRRDGTWIYIRENVQAIRGPDGAILYYDGTVEDITESRRAQEAEREQRALAEALRDTAAALNSTLNFDELLDRMLFNVGRVVPHESAFVMLVEDGVARIVRTRGYTERGADEAVRQIRFQVADFVDLSRIGETGTPLIIADTRTFAEWVYLPETKWIRSQVLAPIRAQERIVGFLGVDSTTPNFFTPTHSAALKAFADQAGIALENARLLAETERRANEFAALYQTAGDLGTPRSLESQLETIVERAQGLLQAAMGFIYLYDARSGDLVLTVGKGILFAPGLHLAIGTGLAGRVAETGQPMIVDDYAHWEHRANQYEQIPYAACVEVPMIYGGELIGVLGVGEFGSSTRRYTESDARLLSLFAGQAASAVSNARLYIETERRANQFAVLYETAQELTTLQELPLLLDLVVERATTLLAAPGGFIYLYDPAHRDLELIVERGGLVPRGTRLNLGEGIAGRVASSHMSLIVDDYHTWELQAVKYANVPYAAMIQVPMLYAGELIGILGVNEIAPSTRRFGEEDARLLSLFAGQAASAVRSARLLQETRAHAQQLALLYDAGLTLNSVLEPTAQLEFLFKIATRALHADRIEFFALDEEKREAVLEMGVGYSGVTQQVISTVRFSLDEERGLLGWIYQNRVPLNIPDLRADPRYVVIDPAIRSGVWAPVEHENEIKGILSILSTELNAFSAQDERLLVLFANQAAVALENARLYGAARQELAERKRVETELRVKIETLQALAEIDREVMAANEIEAIGQLVCRRTADLLHTPKVAIAVSQGAGFHVLASQGLAEPELIQGELQEMRQRMPWGSPPSTGVNLTSISEILPIDSRMPQFREREQVQSLVIGQFVAGDSTLGALAVFDTRPRDWTAGELELLSLMASETANALERTRLLGELRESLAMTTRLYELSGQVLAANTVQETARLITQMLQEALGADMTAIHLLDPEGKPMFYYGIGYPEGYQHRATTLRPDGVTLNAWRTGDPIIVQDPARLNPWLRAQGVLSGIALPLRGEQQSLGVLFVNYRRRHTFTDREVQLLSLFGNQTALALRRVRLLQETRQRADELALLNQISATINQPLLLSQVLTNTVRELSRVLEADSGGVAIFADGSDQLTLIAAYNPENPGLGIGRMIPLEGNPSMEYILRERRPLMVANAADPALMGPVAPVMAELGIRSTLLLPLIVRNEVIGTVGIDNKRSARVFRAEEIALAETIAHHAASAIEKARLFEKTRRRAEQLAVLNRIARAVSHSQHLDSLLETIYQEVRGALTVDGFFLGLYDDATDELDLRLRVDEREHLPAERIPKEATPLTAHVLRTRKTLLIADMEREQVQFQDSLLQRPSSQPLRSWLSVPLQVGTKVTGILSTQAFLPNAYQEEEKQLLETIADQVAVAIENARLFEETSQRLAELEAINQISLTVRAAENSSEMLPRILDETLLVLSMTDGLIALNDPSNRHLRVGAARGWLTQLPTELPKNEGIWARVLTSGEAYVTRDFQHQDLAPKEKHADVPSGWGGAIIPVYTPEGIVGCLVLSVPLPREIHPSETRLLKTIAEIAGSAVHRMRLNESLEASYLETVIALANAIDARDSYTHGHSSRLAEIAVAMANELGFGSRELENIRLAARLHDIGKIGVPDAILLKPGELDELEWQVMKLHPETGAEIIKPVQRLREVVPFVLHHQERFDGSGYPDGLAGDAIPLAARILALADAVTAMLDDRVYRPGFTWEQVRNEIQRCAGTQFDPKLVEILLRLENRVK